MLTDTPQSLLDRLRVESSTRDWETFCQIYRPLIQQQLKRRLSNSSDVDDLAQDILTRVFQSLKTFAHNGRTGAFRKWIGKIVLQQLWRYYQVQTLQGESTELACQTQFPAFAAADLEQQWEAEHDRHVLKKLLELIEPEFSVSTWAAFLAVTVEGKVTREVARDLGLSPNAVMIAKSRVLTRLRSVGRELLDDMQ
ncbi:MAG: RNA polymerase sigma factor [Pirellulaceae bacterium]|jgi:RNA polymerase sigma-70 factor, ECF subfamily|nr:RNA polymerase sigma factor [Pirellulaceae bacterium]